MMRSIEEDNTGKSGPTPEDLLAAAVIQITERLGLSELVTDELNDGLPRPLIEDDTA